MRFCLNVYESKCVCVHLCMPACAPAGFPAHKYASACGLVFCVSEGTYLTQPVGRQRGEIISEHWWTKVKSHAEGEMSV